MDVKKFLNRYYYMTKRLEQLEALNEEYIRMSHSIPSVQFDQIRVSGTKSLEAPFVKWIHKSMGVEQDIKILTNNMEIVKAEILSTISELENADYQRLLIYRYLDRLTWEQIAEKLYCSVASVKRWHVKALNNLKIQPIIV